MQPKISFCLEWKMVSNLMRHSANACTTCVEAANLTGMQLFILEYLYQHQQQDVFQRDLEAENRALRKQLAQKDEVIEILKKSVGILSRP